MKKILMNVLTLLTCMFLLGSAAYAWWSAATSIATSIEIETGQLDITVVLYRAFDEPLDGTLDYYTVDEANEISNTKTGYNAFSVFPKDISTAKGCLMIEVFGEEEGYDYYYLFEPVSSPYTIVLDNMLLTEQYSYLVVAQNTSQYVGSIVASLSGFPSTNDFARELQINEQLIDDTCDAEGKGTFYFTHEFNSPVPSSGTPKENGITIGKNEVLYLPFNISITNSTDNQSHLMNKSLLSAVASIEIAQQI